MRDEIKEMGLILFISSLIINFSGNEGIIDG